MTLLLRYFLFSILLLLLSIWMGLFTFGFSWAERIAQARSQQRHGIGLMRAGGLSGIWADFLKLWYKAPKEKSKLATLLVLISLVLPVLFFACIVQLFGPFDGGRGELFVLLFILVLSVLLEQSLIYSSIDGRERFAFHHSGDLIWLSISAFLLSVTPAILWTGNGSLSAINRLQEGFPYFLFLRSPGAPLSAFAGFLSLLVLLRMGPAQLNEGHYFAGKWGRAFFWVRRLWTVSLSGFWVLVFFGGGPTGIVSFFGFNLRMIFILLLLLWIQVSYARARITDLSHFILAFVFPIGLAGAMIEILYVALGRLIQ